ncbi:pyrroline-5-carboxylate reductase [Peptococcaceae bacterium]|nr:pyrroline-5-carboxylate reductase [Peptococcaceae bacterium]
MEFSTSIGFLGGGVMAEALITGIIKSGLLSADKIFVSDINYERLNTLKRKIGIQVVNSNAEILKKAELLIIAVKPHAVDQVLNDIKDEITPSHEIISIAAGIKTSYIESHLNKKVPVIRVMPNTPCLVRSGVSAISCGAYAGAEQESKAKAIFESVGHVVFVEEKLLDAVTGLSGSGPAYMYIILEALSDAGVSVGLPRDIAMSLALHTMIGSAKMVLETKKHPAELKDMVTTPAGTTIAGIRELERGKLRSTLIDAVTAATLRSKQLSSKNQ